MHGVVAELFAQLTKEMCIYLDCMLPKLSDNWWQNHVRVQLSFQQVQIVEQYRITELMEFDLVMFHKFSFSG